LDHGKNIRPTAPTKLILPQAILDFVLRQSGDLFLLIVLNQVLEFSRQQHSLAR